MTPNTTAFLDTIATSEGTAGRGDNGYNVLVGGGLFTGAGGSAPVYNDHPRIAVHLAGGLVSTAAGRYQIIDHTFDLYKAKLGLPDFSPASQDRIALALIADHGAGNYVDDGQFDLAVTKVAKVWASLPGAGYGQHENKLAALRQVYRNAGGALAPPVQQEVTVNPSHVGYTAGAVGVLVPVLVWATHWPIQPLDAKDTAPAVASLLVMAATGLRSWWMQRQAAKITLVAGITPAVPVQPVAKAA